ncbi:YjiH family protein [Robertmurraya korlensis]|uniref:YjiH family protein n=1 Tax=Robertmurraya korlensis TaxID=519977 RepID=UPI0008265DAA|nr:YjiH family protein [Robertmurraya korlensis]
MEAFKKLDLNTRNVLSFAIPAFIGLFIFLVPITYEEKTAIIIGMILQLAAAATKSFTPYLVVAVMVISAILSLIGNLIKPDFLTKNSTLTKLFIPSMPIVILRVIGAVLGVLVLFQLGSEMVYSIDTGGTMLDLSASIMVWFIVASFFIPFLLDFGLLEFIGTLLSGIARPLFKLPGRASVDLLTSIVGDQNLGVMLTNDQYVRGYYTGREAVIISTCFSATGVGYWYIISSILEVDHYFTYILLTVFISLFAVAVIMTRLWPITSFKNSYYKEKAIMEDQHPEGMGIFQFALQLAVQKAKTYKGLKSMIKRSVHFSVDVVFAVIPIVMVVGTAGLFVATYTPILEWLSVPFKYYLQLLQVPEAAKAAPAVIAGFVDMLIPALISTDIESVKTKFIITVLSLTQIIYMSEVGPVILTSKIPVNLWHLAVIFIIRTLLLLPIIVLLASLFGIPA